jgi:hypothetical protein
MPMFHPDAPDVRRPDSRQLQDLLDEARGVLDILEHGHKPEKDNATRLMSASELLDLARQRKQYTGLPTSTRREGGGASVKDDQNVPMPQLSDPVGELVVSALSDAGPLEHHARTILRCLRSAVDELRSASGALAKATPAQDNNPVGEPGCKVHANYGVWEATYRR